MIIGSRQRLSVQCDHVEIRVDDQIIKRVDHTKSLGLTIDAQSLFSYWRPKTCAALYIQSNCISNL